jgi:hypothetical protein
VISLLIQPIAAMYNVQMMQNDRSVTAQSALAFFFILRSTSSVAVDGKNFSHLLAGLTQGDKSDYFKRITIQVDRLMNYFQIA